MNETEGKYENFDWVLSALQMMIDETMYHMQTFAHTLEVHHNKEVAQIFSVAYEQFKIEHEIICSHMGTRDLPTIAPWETPYPDYQHPSEVLSEVDYLSTQEEAWTTIHKVNQNHKGFYDFLLKESEHSELLILMQELLIHCQRSEMTNQKEVINILTQDTERDDDLDLISNEDFKSMFQ